MSNTNIEFIAAKDLPMTEAEEVNVLCVENGELKLKNASNLGGNKEEEEPVPEWDAIIEVSQDENGVIYTLTLGSFESLKTSILNHQIPKVLLTGEAGGIHNMMVPNGFAFSESDNMILLVTAIARYIISPDNTVMQQ